MFDTVIDRPQPLLDAGTLQQWREQVTAAARDGLAGLSDSQRIDLLRTTEELTGALAGMMTVVTAAFDESQQCEQATAGVAPERRDRGIGAQIAFARRCSHHRGQQYLRLSRALVADLPCTLDALIGGRITEWRAGVISEKTSFLARDHRAVVDESIAGTPERVDRLESWSNRQLEGRLLHLAQELDVEAVVRRRRRAEAERRVTGRPAPDAMMYLTALLPAKDGVGVLAALTRTAASVVATGDPRTKGQIMADTLVARCTGREPVAGPTDVVIDLVITDHALFGGGAAESGSDVFAGGESAYLYEYGPIPADLARDIASQGGIPDTGDTNDETARVWLRRLYTDPAGNLVAMESTARLFPARLADLIRLRDRRCRTPWCDAPIRHIDHVVPHADGGPTTVTNGQGLCTGCNHAKQAPGWTARSGLDPDGRHTVTLRTPTGHRYRSSAPPLAS